MRIIGAAVDDIYHHDIGDVVHIYSNSNYGLLYMQTILEAKKTLLLPTGYTYAMTNLEKVSLKTEYADPWSLLLAVKGSSMIYAGKALREDIRFEMDQKFASSSG